MYYPLPSIFQTSYFLSLMLVHSREYTPILSGTQLVERGGQFVNVSRAAERKYFHLSDKRNLRVRVLCVKR
jgi:hypothetical protein